MEITLSNGVTGIGAANPSEYVTGEHLDMTMASLTEANLEFLKGRDIREINQLLFEFTWKFPKTPAARAALDIALHDAFTKYLGIPLVKYLGQKISSMPTSNTIGIKNVEETVKETDDYVKRGFKASKVKTGKNVDEDIERLVKMQEKHGRKMTIRVDANQGYTAAQTVLVQYYCGDRPNESPNGWTGFPADRIGSLLLAGHWVRGRHTFLS